MSPVYKFSNVGGFKSKTTYVSMLAGNPFTPVITDIGSMFPLGFVNLSQDQNTIQFTNIPQTYTHLHLRWNVRTTAAVVESWQSMRFNSNTSGYHNHLLFGNGTTATSTYESLSDRINFGTTPGNSALSNTFGIGIIEILDYKNTNKNKVTRHFDGYDNNGAGVIGHRTGLWINTSAITSISFGPQNFSGSINYAAGSTFALYGVL